MRKAVIVLLLHILAQWKSIPFPITNLQEVDTGDSSREQQQEKGKSDNYKTTCYKPTDDWFKAYFFDDVSALQGCDDRCANSNAAGLLQMYKDKLELGKSCYIRCPCECLSFCADTSRFSEKVTCPPSKSPQGVYCPSDYEDLTEENTAESSSSGTIREDQVTTSTQPTHYPTSSAGSLEGNGHAFSPFSQTSSTLFTTSSLPLETPDIRSASTLKATRSYKDESTESKLTTLPEATATTAKKDSIEEVVATTRSAVYFTTDPLVLTSQRGVTNTYHSEEIRSGPSTFALSTKKAIATTDRLISDGTTELGSVSTDASSSEEELRSSSREEVGASSSSMSSTTLPVSELIGTTFTSANGHTEDDAKISSEDGEKTQFASTSTTNEGYLQTSAGTSETSWTNRQSTIWTTTVLSTFVTETEDKSIVPNEVLSSSTSTSTTDWSQSDTADNQRQTTIAEEEHVELRYSRSVRSSYAQKEVSSKSTSEIHGVQTTTATTKDDSEISGAQPTTSALTSIPSHMHNLNLFSTASSSAWSAVSTTEKSSSTTLSAGGATEKPMSITWSERATEKLISATESAERASLTATSTTDETASAVTGTYFSSYYYFLKRKPTSSSSQTPSTTSTAVVILREEGSTVANTSSNTEAATSNSPNCSLPCPPEYVEGASYCYRFAHKSVHTYRAAVRYCSLEKNSYLAGLVDLRKDELLPLLRNASDENSTLAELLFINEQKSKFFTVTNTARIVSLTRSSGTLLRIVRTAGIDEYLANATGICKIPKHCRDFECYLGDIAFYGISKELQLPENRTMSPGETAKVLCKNGKTVDLACDESGSFDPHPSMIPCYADDEERDTPFNPRIRKSCEECHRLGTKRCVRVQGGVRCDCHEGWSKFTCWKSPDMCKLTQLQCLHGSCKSEVDRAYCECDYGFAGTYCTVNKTSITMYSDTENSIVSSQTGSAAALVLTKTFLLLTYILLKTEDTLRRSTDPQIFYQRVRSFILVTAGMFVLLYRHPGVLVITKRMCRIIFFGITSLFLAAVGTFALEARNACETVKLQHLNAWRDEPAYSSRTISLGALLAKTNSLGKQLLTVFVFSAGAVTAIFAAKYEQVSTEWSCMGLFEKETINLWFPLVLLHHIAALAATSYSYEGLSVVRLLPQLREQLDEYLKTVPNFVKNDIEKSSRNLIFSMIGPWLLTCCWLSLAVSNDWVASPVMNMLTLSSALLYCAFDLLQFAVTSPLVYSKLVWLAMKWLPASLSPKQDPVTMMRRNEVVKRFQLRKVARRSRAGRLSNPAHEGYVPRVARREMKKRWNRGYKKLREIHDRKTKASVIHMIHRNDVVRLLLEEKNKEKRKTIRKLFLRWSAVTYRDDPKPDVVFRRRTMFDILMDEIEEIRRNLRLLHQPTHREVFNNIEENTDRRTEISIEKCIITTIDPYGNTQQQVVLKTPIHMIDSEDVPSTSSRRGTYDRMERGENRRNDDEDDDDDILSKETLEWLEMASETTFDMAAQNQDYMDQLRALRSW